MKVSSAYDDRKKKHLIYNVIRYNIDDIRSLSCRPWVKTTLQSSLHESDNITLVRYNSIWLYIRKSHPIEFLMKEKILLKEYYRNCIIGMRWRLDSYNNLKIIV